MLRLHYSCHVCVLCVCIGILDEEDPDDTLVNVNMMDDEQANSNVENKKKKPDYKPYDEPEFDEYGTVSSNWQSVFVTFDWTHNHSTVRICLWMLEFQLKVKDILEKYTEEIDGKKKAQFELGKLCDLKMNH